MTEHPIDQGLRSLGVDPAGLDPDVLAALPEADQTNRKPQTLEDAFAVHYRPGAEDQRRRKAEAQRDAILEGN